MFCASVNSTKVRPKDLFIFRPRFGLCHLALLLENSQPLLAKVLAKLEGVSPAEGLAPAWLLRAT